MPGVLDAITGALQHAGFHSAISKHQPLSGGCVASVYQVTLEDGHKLVAKVGSINDEDAFRKEIDGLLALGKPGILIVPEPYPVTIAAGHPVLLMESIETGRVSLVGDDVWARFGRDLAEHHGWPQEPRYGWDHDNFIGSTPQRNTWSNDWVEFNARCRLGPQLTMAESAGLLDGFECNAVRRVIDRLADFIPRQPKPALLHGDLWSGNALPTPTADGVRVAVIDPAVYVGDGIADLAMMRLFGGFPEVCFEAYVEVAGKQENLRERITVYQLYHILNHLNLFGRGYAASVNELTRQLIG